MWLAAAPILGWVVGWPRAGSGTFLPSFLVASAHSLDKSDRVLRPLGHYPSAVLHGFAILCSVFVIATELAPPARSVKPSPGRLMDDSVDTAALASNLSLQAFLSERGFSNREHLLVTLADESYMDTFIRHTHAAIRRTIPDGRFLVLCTDRPCVDVCNRDGIYAYGGYMAQADADAGLRDQDRIGFVKFQAAVDLVRAGHAFVFMDGDVGIREDPMGYMLPLDDPSWDLAAQDNGEQTSLQINIGWLYSKANAKTLQFWLDCMDMLHETHHWDQRIVNSQFGLPREGRDNVDAIQSAGGVRLSVLPQDLFRTWLRNEWMTGLEIYSQNDAVILHMFCPGNGPREKFYILGGVWGWEDVDSMYTDPRPFLEVTQLNGTEAQVQQAIRVAISLAQRSRRALLLPYTTRVAQPARPKDLYMRPTSRVFPIHKIWTVVHLLEPGYLKHAGRFLPPLEMRQFWQNDAPTLPLKSLHSTEEASQLLDTYATATRVKLPVDLADLVDGWSSSASAANATDVFCKTRYERHAGCQSHPWCGL